MEAKRHGHYLVLWSVVDCDDDVQKVVGYFKDPNKAADFALGKLYAGVEMILCKPEWNVKTMD